MLGDLADLLGDLRDPALLLLSGFDGSRGNPAGRLIVGHAANELGLARLEDLEQLARLHVGRLVLGARLLVGGAQGLTVFLVLVPQHNKLLAGRRRAGGRWRRGAETGTARSGHSHAGHARHPTKLRVRGRDGHQGRHGCDRKDPAECHRYPLQPPKL